MGGFTINELPMPSARALIVVDGCQLGYASTIGLERFGGWERTDIDDDISTIRIALDEPMAAFLAARTRMTEASDAPRDDRLVLRGSRERLTRVLQTISCALAGSGRYEDDGVVVEVEG